MRRLVGFLVVALLVYFVIVRPVAAADSVSNLGGLLKNAADSVTTFFTRLV